MYPFIHGFVDTIKRGQNERIRMILMTKNIKKSIKFHTCNLDYLGHGERKWSYSMREIRKVEIKKPTKKQKTNKLYLHSFCTTQFKDNLEFKLQANNRRLHKVRFNKSQVNIKLKGQVTGRRLHETSLTSLVVRL